MSPSLAVFMWFQIGTLPAGANLDLPPFNRFMSCVYAAENTGTDIQYPSHCPRHWESMGLICFPGGGYYDVNLQISMRPGPEAEGSILMESQNPPPYIPMPDYYGNSQFLIQWKARPDGFTLQGNTVVLKADAGECFRLKYWASAPATVNPDARATRLTIHKLD